MREIEKTTQYLINDGFDIGTGRDPYKNLFIPVSRNWQQIFPTKEWDNWPKRKGNKMLAKMCSIIAGDEMRHHLAYREFVKIIFEHDPK
jgi:acyl-[acyl-carrier-protein] desaturase